MCWSWALAQGFAAWWSPSWYVCLCACACVCVVIIMLRYRAWLQGANVTITELPELLPVLEQNVKLNNLHEKCAVRSLPVQTACVDREERGGEGEGGWAEERETHARKYSRMHVGPRVTQGLARGRRADGERK